MGGSHQAKRFGIAPHRRLRAFHKFLVFSRHRRRDNLDHQPIFQPELDDNFMFDAVVRPRDKALRHARTCYDHLAGHTAVAMADTSHGRRRGRSCTRPALAQRWSRTPSRRITRAGALLTALGVLGWGFAQEPWQLFLATPISGAGWAMTSGAALNAMVAPWFVRRRPAALSMAFNGASMGGVIFSPCG
jgi:hypothetical protein